MDRQEQRSFGWSFQIARIAGIPVRVHFTFLLLVVIVGRMGAAGGGSAMASIILLLLLFVCIVLHELGHALTARRFGVGTTNIVLYPFGGIARLESMPGGKAELLIALAGPAVNFALAALLFVVWWFTGPPLQVIASEEFQGGSLVLSLLGFNVMLFLFNLLPAFPMDGGRVLRAFLTLRMGAERATTIAATVGQVMAFLMGAVGLYTQSIVLLFIAFFVFVGAGHEALAQRQRSSVLGHNAREAMISRFETLAPNDTLSNAASHLLSTHQQDFPVVDAWNRVAGVLPRSRLMQGLAGNGPEAAVLEVMERQFPVLRPDAPLESVLEALRRNPGLPVLVMDEDRLQGMITLENLTEFIDIVQSTRTTAPRDRPAGTGPDGSGSD